MSCPVCWAKVTNCPAGLSQHQYWSVACNTWRVPWEEAAAWAERVKEQREREWTGVSAVTAPAPSKRRLE